MWAVMALKLESGTVQTLELACTTAAILEMPVSDVKVSINVHNGRAGTEIGHSYPLIKLE